MFLIIEYMSLSNSRRYHPQLIPDKHSPYQHRTESQSSTQAKRVLLTPELFRSILTLPEVDQKALIMQTFSKEQEKEKLKLVQRVMALPEFAARLEEDESMLPRAYLQHEEEPEGPQIKSQVRAMESWSLIFVTVIATASVLFETFHELLNRVVPKALLEVVNKFFGELATLGFIGTVSFLLINFGVMAHISLWFTGNDELLIHEFEFMHYMVFVIMALFISSVLLLLVHASRKEEVWARFEAEWAKAGERSGARSALLRMPPTETLPDRAAPVDGGCDSADRSEVSLAYEVANRPPAARRAEFLRFRQRFIADQECEVEIPDDFNFAGYMAHASAHILSQLVEVGVYDWLILWGCFAATFLCVALIQAVCENFQDSDATISLEQASCVLVFLAQVCSQKPMFKFPQNTPLSSTGPLFSLPNLK